MRPLILLLLPFFLSATPLRVLIQHARESHLSLQAIKQKILATEYQYKTTKKFSDPIISFGLSDIQFADPTNRALEPMQYSSLHLKQSIPFFGKREADGQKVLAQRQVLEMDLQQTIIELIEAIKRTSYQIWQADELLKITDQYIALTKQDIHLYLAYSKSESHSHIQMIAAKLFLSELKIKQSNLRTIVTRLYQKLDYLSDMHTLHVKDTMDINKPKPLSFYLAKATSNKMYNLKKALVKEADTEVKIKKLASYPDPFVQVGYYHRQKFHDYASVSVGFSLPIYGTQKLNRERSEAIALSKKSESANFKNALISKIRQTYANLQNAYRIYQILTQQTLPQIKSMQQISGAYMQNGSSLFVYIDTLKKQLAIDEQKVAAIASYHTYLAALDALIGSQDQ